MGECESPVVSIVIVNWNTRELLRRCLESVYSTVPPVAFDAAVVDNASEDGSAEIVAERFPQAALIRSASNLGFAAGSNLGIQRSKGEYILLLNADTELLPGSVSRMIEFMNLHPRAGLVGPKLVGPDGTLQENGRRLPGLLREVLSITQLYKLFRGWFDRTMGYGRENFGVVARVDEVCGACMFVRKSAVDEVGLLDERFFMYYEEVDWCFRMKKAGWEVYYEPRSQVVHHWAQAARQLGLRGSRVFYQSQYLYFWKHHGLTQALILRGLSYLLLAALMVKYVVLRRWRTKAEK